MYRPGMNAFRNSLIRLGRSNFIRLTMHLMHIYAQFAKVDGCEVLCFLRSCYFRKQDNHFSIPLSRDISCFKEVIIRFANMWFQDLPMLFGQPGHTSMHTMRFVIIELRLVITCINNEKARQWVMVKKFLLMRQIIFGDEFNGTVCFPSSTGIFFSPFI